MLSANILIEKYDPELINEMLSYLKLENCSIVISSKTFQGQTDSKEKYFGTDYKIEDFSLELIEKLKNPGLNQCLKFPEPNEFIPTNFNIIKADSELSKVPVVILNSDIIKAWYLKDEIYLKPKVFYGIKIVKYVNFKITQLVLVLDGHLFISWINFVTFLIA